MAHGEAAGRPLPCARAAAARLPHLALASVIASRAPCPRERQLYAPVSLGTCGALQCDGNDILEHQEIE
jgi:hypothetical protein